MGAFFSFEHLSLLCASTLLSYITTLIAGVGRFGLCLEEQQLSRDATMTFIKYSLLSRGKATVKAADRGNARSQAELGKFHAASALRLDFWRVSQRMMTRLRRSGQRE